jgi:SAM-dependent methyltransferase
LWGRKRPDSLVSSSTAISASGTSNGGSYAIRGGGGGERKQKGPGTFGGLPEEEEEFVQHKAMQTRHGIRKHAHPVSEVPYPISYEEVVLQGEKHTQELLSMVLQQKAYHFTPLEGFAKLKNVLDIGCGRGYWLMDAAKDLKHANLVGFDLVDVFMKPHEMRERKGLNDAQIARIEFVQGNFFNGLPFASERFDFIRIAFLELAIPESKWVPLLKEAWRALKPGGHIEVIIETLLFPTVWSYDKLPVQSALEGEFKHMLEERDIPPTTNIGEKMFFDAFARVQTHQHVSVCIAPRPAGRSSLDNPTSPRNYGSMRSTHSPWSSEPIVRTGVVSPTPYGRPSLDRSRTSFDVLPPAGHLITSQTCTVPGIVISPDTFIPVSEDNLYTYASHGARILNSTRLATFFDKHPNASEHDAFDDGFEKEWRAHVERYWQYEKNNRNRLGFRNNQFDDEDDEIPIPPPGPSIGRWKWSKCDEDIERPLEIRRFRAWSLTKPISTR